MALYFGPWAKNRIGHYLYNEHGRQVYPNPTHWPDHVMDSRLLKNGCVPDEPDGRVFWTCGVAWHAFFWWDRSADTRGACNSGFYVCGFGVYDRQAAYEFALSRFPGVVARQLFPLVLVPQEVDTRCAGLHVGVLP